jgi:hypothetical protein
MRFILQDSLQALCAGERAFTEASCKQTVQIKAIVENASDDEQTWRRMS